MVERPPNPVPKYRPFVFVWIPVRDPKSLRRWRPRPAREELVDAK